MTFSQVVYIIIFVVTLLIILLFFSDFARYLQYKHVQYTCKASIKTSQDTLLAQGMPTIKCPTLYEDIPKADGKENERKEKYMEEIASRMAATWGLFGEGKYRLFSGEGGTFCVITYYLTFDEETRISSREFLDYMNTHTMPGDNAKRTYQQYLMPPPFQGQVAPDLELNLPLLELSTKAPQLVIFRYYQPSLFNKLLPGGPELEIDKWQLFFFLSGRGDANAVIKYRGGDWDSMVMIAPYTVNTLKGLGGWGCTSLPSEQQKVNKANP